MTATIDQIIQAIAPGLSNDLLKETYVCVAETRTSQCYFGDTYNLAVALRAAHMWSLSNRSGGVDPGAAGAVSSLQEKDLKVSFNTGTLGQSDLAQTNYGRQLQDLIAASNPAATVLGGKLPPAGCD